MKLNREALRKIVAAVSKPIPKPATKPAKPAESWRKLRRGDKLETLIEFRQPGGIIHIGERVEVTSLNNQGVELLCHTNNIQFRFVRTDWPKYFNRVGKVVSKKKLTRKKKVK